jgi:hypothetical protein
VADQDDMDNLLTLLAAAASTSSWEFRGPMT